MRNAAGIPCLLLLVACSTTAPGATGTPGQPTPTQPGGSTVPTNPGDTAAPTGTSTGEPQPTGTGEAGVWHVGGTVSGLDGSGLVLYDLGENLAVNQDGPFTFPQPLPDGAIYRVTVITQPGDPDQGCTISNGTGTVFGADVTDVAVECTTVATSPFLDAEFGAGGKVMTGMTSGQAEGVAIDDQGRIVVAGRGADGGSQDFVVARYNPDGSLDTTFGSGGITSTDVSGGTDEAFDVAIASDHKIVVVGIANERAGDDFGVVRYKEDGSLDETFGNGGIVMTDFAGGVDRAYAVVTIDESVIVAGHAANGQDNDFALARYYSNGTLDNTFGGDGLVMTDIAGQGDFASAMALTPAADKIVVVGRVAADGVASPDFGVVRYGLDGTPDPEFGQGGIVRTDFGGGTDDAANGVVVLADNSIVVGGHSIGATSFDFALAKYLVDGQLDGGFGTGGLVTTDFGAGQDYGQALALGPADTIVVVGNSQGTVYDMAIARYAANGTLDPSFGDGGLVTVDFHGSGETGQDVATQTADGKAVVAGYAQNGSDTEFVLVRLAP